MHYRCGTTYGMGMCIDWSNPRQMASLLRYLCLAALGQAAHQKAPVNPAGAATCMLQLLLTGHGLNPYSPCGLDHACTIFQNPLYIATPRLMLKRTCCQWCFFGANIGTSHADNGVASVQALHYSTCGQIISVVSHMQSCDLTYISICCCLTSEHESEDDHKCLFCCSRTHSGRLSMPTFCTPDTEDAAVKSQLETVAEEYNHLLVSQLESQRRYYEVGASDILGCDAPATF